MNLKFIDLRDAGIKGIRFALFDIRCGDFYQLGARRSWGTWADFEESGAGMKYSTAKTYAKETAYIRALCPPWVFESQ